MSFALADRVGLVLERDERGDRAEHLLAGDAVVVRRLDERARVPEALAVRHVSAVERIAVDEARHLLPVLRRDERPHLGLLVGGVSDADSFRGLDQPLRKLVVGGALDEDPRAGAAVLACVVEDGIRSRGGGTIEIGVGEHDVGRLAAQLERDALDRRRRAFHDGTADLGRAGEADLRDVRVLDQPPADDRALAGDDVEDAFGDAGFQRQLGEAEHGQRRQLGGLEDDGVAARERRADLPARDVEREVPRHDEADDAERLAERRGDAAGDGDRVAVVLVDGARVEVEDLRHHADLAACARDGLADVLRLDPGKLLVVLLDERRESPQQPGAIGGRDGAPGRERFLRACDASSVSSTPACGSSAIGSSVAGLTTVNVIRARRGARARSW